MHFITETELRSKFRAQAFDKFCLNENERLTPGAKQFLQDKKIELQSAEEPAQGEPNTAFFSMIGYNELLSAAFFEAALLAKEHQLALGQKLLLLEKQTSTVLMNQTPTAEISEDSIELKQFQLEPIHIFSEQGLLLIQLKKIHGLLCLMIANYPEHCPSLSVIIQELRFLVKSLVGDADE